MPHPKDLVGQQFSRLTVMYKVQSQKGQSRWMTKCICGTEKVIHQSNLIGGHSTSCGCYMRSSARIRNIVHGKSKTPEYSAWYNMVRRCHQPTNQSFADYGARGITVCDTWRTSFETFLTDIGVRPGRYFMLERIDNNQGYSPENCRWATPKEQAHNRRSNRLIAISGRSQAITDLAESIGMHVNTLRARIFLAHLSPEEAISRPVRAHLKRPQC